MIESPCINVCRMSEAHGVCIGCYRTLDEIAQWSLMSDEQRAAVLQKLADRRRTIGEFAPALDADPAAGKRGRRMRRIDWYFDVISPFSYLCRERLSELPADIEIVYRPVLLAGLLGHWGQKGPGEIPPKRRYTYRWCRWLAGSLGVPFEFPAAHPFNSLPYMRLITAAGAAEDVVRRVFDAVWTTGEDLADEQRFAALCRELNIDPAQLLQPQVKDALRDATAQAAALGVFGVPTFVIDGEIFWGLDAFDFLRAYLADPSVLRNDAMRRIDTLPVGAVRKNR